MLQDVPSLGKKYDIKNVSDGYARNFLIPRKLVQIATTANIQSIERRRKQMEQEHAIQKDILAKNIDSLDGVKVTYRAKTNEKGHLFAGIHKEDIIKILKEQKHIDIPEELIELDQPIKELGEYKIKIKNKELVLEVIKS